LLLLLTACCRNDHPDLQDAGSSSSSSARASPISPQPDGPSDALVRQPPQQLLLGLLIDSLWPPRASKDNYVKGQVRRVVLYLLVCARWIVLLLLLLGLLIDSLWKVVIWSCTPLHLLTI
jgi:hypothetical protein